MAYHYMHVKIGLVLVFVINGVMYFIFSNRTRHYGHGFLLIITPDLTLILIEQKLSIVDKHVLISDGMIIFRGSVEITNLTFLNTGLTSLVKMTWNNMKIFMSILSDK